MKQNSNQNKTLPKKSNGKNDSRPAWIDTVSDLSIYKSTPQDLERKKVLSKSKHANAAKLEILQKIKAQCKRNIRVFGQDGKKNFTNPVLTSDFLFQANKISTITSPKERLEMIKGIWKNASKSNDDLAVTSVSQFTVENNNIQDSSERIIQEDQQDIELKECQIKKLGNIIHQLKYIDTDSAVNPELYKMLNKLKHIFSELEESTGNIKISCASYLEIPKITNISDFSFCLLSIVSRLIHALVQISNEYTKQSKHNEELTHEVSKQRLLIGELSTELEKMKMQQLENPFLELQQYPKHCVRKIDGRPVLYHSKISSNPNLPSARDSGRISNLTSFNENKTCEPLKDKSYEISENTPSTSSGPGGDLNRCFWYKDQSGTIRKLERAAVIKQKLYQLKGRKHADLNISFPCTKSVSQSEASETVKNIYSADGHSSLCRTVSEDNVAYHMNFKHAIPLSKPKQLDTVKMSNSLESDKMAINACHSMQNKSWGKISKTELAFSVSANNKTNLKQELDITSLSTFGFTSESSVLIDNETQSSFAPETSNTDYNFMNSTYSISSSGQTTPGNSGKIQICHDSQVEDEEAECKLDMDDLFKKLEVLQTQCICDNNKLQSLLDSKPTA